jgi:hypothetical protein
VAELYEKEIFSRRDSSKNSNKRVKIPGENIVKGPNKASSSQPGDLYGH